MSDFDLAIARSFSSVEEDRAYMDALSLSKSYYDEEQMMLKATIEASKTENMWIEESIPTYQEKNVWVEESAPEYHEQNVPGDGNCYFHCLSYVMGGQVDELRRQVVQYVREHYREFENSPYLEGITLQQWLETMSQDGVFADILAVQATSECFQIPVSIQFKVGNGLSESDVYGVQYDIIDPVKLILHNVHYTVLL